MLADNLVLWGYQQIYLRAKGDLSRCLLVTKYEGSSPVMMFGPGERGVSCLCWCVCSVSGYR
jgi:hypothetical protein